MDDSFHVPNIYNASSENISALEDVNSKGFRDYGFSFGGVWRNSDFPGFWIK